MLKFKDIKLIQVQDWNKLVSSMYSRPYNFQQQSGCRDRGVFSLSIPCYEYDLQEEEEMSDSIPEVVNGNEMGVRVEGGLEFENPTEDGKELFPRKVITIDFSTCENWDQCMELMDNQPDYRTDYDNWLKYWKDSGLINEKQLV